MPNMTLKKHRCSWKSQYKYRVKLLNVVRGNKGDYACTMHCETPILSVFGSNDFLDTYLLALNSIVPSWGSKLNLKVWKCGKHHFQSKSCFCILMIYLALSNYESINSEGIKMSLSKTFFFFKYFVQNPKILNSQWYKTE